ncbi:hypothetical protein [Spirosoma arcticum]
MAFFFVNIPFRSWLADSGFGKIGKGLGFFAQGKQDGVCFEQTVNGFQDWSPPILSNER